MSILERNISLRIQNMMLKDALEVVAEKAGFQWSYNAAMIEGEKKVALWAEDVTVREALVRLLGDGFEFKQSGNYLILKRKRKPESKLSGYITDPRTGKKMSNVTVYDRKTLRATVTDSNGYYELRVPERTEIVVAKLDFRETVLQVTPQTPRFVKVEMQFDSVVPQLAQKPPADTQNDPFNFDEIEEEVTLFSKYLKRKSQQAEEFFTRKSQQISMLNVRDSALARRVQVSLLPWLGTNHALSGLVKNDFSLNLLVGYSRANNGVELGGVGNITRTSVQGLQAAGVFNEIGGNLQGLQAAGIYNRSGGRVRGAQAAGVLNLAHHAETSSVQAAGVINVAMDGKNMALQTAGVANHLVRGSVSVQAAGAVNTADKVNGLQAAGILNTARRFNGLQAAGLLNASGDANGLQVASLLNIADSIQGAQISTLLNRAKRIRGLQIGLINVAGEINGLQLGLLNFSKRGGYVALELSSNEVFEFNASFKTGTPAFYMIYAGSHKATPEADYWAYGIGVGCRPKLVKRLGFSFDLIYRHVNDDRFDAALQGWGQAALALDFRLGRHFSLAFGPTANAFLDTPDKPDSFTGIRDKVAPRIGYEERWDDGTRLSAWLGWTGALRFKF